MNLTSPADTLVCDTVQIALWQSDPAYNYNRELITPEMNVFEWISRQFGELMRKIFGSRFAEEYSGLILICIAIFYFAVDCLVSLSETSRIVYGLS